LPLLPPSFQAAGFVHKAYATNIKKDLRNDEGLMKKFVRYAGLAIRQLRFYTITRLAR
jgi:hypothetical protein